MTSLSATDTPCRDLLMSAASMKAMISKVSFGSTGGTPVRKNLAISTSSGPLVRNPARFKPGTKTGNPLTARIVNEGPKPFTSTLRLSILKQIKRASAAAFKGLFGAPP
jgi:hypothetical protein